MWQGSWTIVLKNMFSNPLVFIQASTRDYSAEFVDEVKGTTVIDICYYRGNCYELCGERRREGVSCRKNNSDSIAILWSDIHLAIPVIVEFITVCCPYAYECF